MVSFVAVLAAYTGDAAAYGNGVVAVVCQGLRATDNANRADIAAIVTHTLDSAPFAAFVARNVNAKRICETRLRPDTTSRPAPGSLPIRRTTRTRRSPRPTCGNTRSRTT